MGLILNGKVLEFPGSERIRDGREVDAWWEAGAYGTGPRAGDIDVQCTHWTAGEAGLKDPDGAGPLTEYDDDGPRVVRSMKARPSKTDPTKKLQVSVQFVIGACDPDDEECYAPIWQTMDIGASTAIHVGDRATNRRSIGFEVVNSGEHGGPLDTRGRRPFTTRLQPGGVIKVAEFFPGQRRSIAWLGHVLSSALDGTDLGRALDAARIRIPRRYPAIPGGAIYNSRFTPGQLRRWKGALEHFHIPGTTKIDAALMGIAALRDHGGFLPALV